VGLLYAFADFMDAGPGMVWSVPWLLVAGAVVEAACIAAHAGTARRPLGPDAGVAVQVLLLGARLEFDERRVTRRHLIAIALSGPIAALVLVVLGATSLSGVGPGFVHDGLWSFTFAAAFGVLQLLPLTIESRDGRRWRSSGRLILEALGLLEARPARVEPVGDPGSAAHVTHAPLRNPDGAALGVEPLPRARAEDAPDDGLARRAVALGANRWRSTPPPGPPPPLWFGREEDPPQAR
jgi:hypothetical protein